MNEEIKELKMLQEIYLKKNSLVTKATELNSEQKHRIEIIEQTEKLLDILVKQQKDLKKSKDKLELDIKTVDENLKDSEDKIVRVTNATELQALQKQIENIKSQKSVAEQRLMKVYTLQEGLTKKIDGVNEKYAHYKRSTGILKSRVDKFMKTADNRLDELDKEILKLRREISENMLSYFDNIFKATTDIVIAKVEEQRCSCCNQVIPLQDYIDLKAGKRIIKCAYCDRILYVDEAEIKKNS